MRKYNYLLSLLLAIGLVTAFTLITLLTNIGLRMVFAVSQHVIRGKLNVTTLNGHLTGGIEATGIHYEDPHQSLTIGNLTLHANVLQLLRHHLTIKPLFINQITYTRTTKLAKQPNRTWHIDQVSGQLAIFRHQLHIDSLNLKQANLNATLQGTMQYRPPFQTQLHLILSGYLTPKQPVQGSVNLHGDQDVMQLTGTLKHPFISEWKGCATHWRRTNGTFHLSGQWHNLVLNLPPKTAIQSQQGRLTLQGTPKHYQLELKTDLASRRLPQSQWALSAVGQLHHIQLTHIDIQTLKGQLNAKGEVAWQPNLQWHFAIQATHLQPAVKWPTWQGDISFQSTIDGRYTQQLEALHWRLDALSGQWQHQPLQGKWQLDLSPDRIKVPHATLSIGESHLQLNGQFNHRWQFDFQIHIPQLANLYPAITGTVESQGTLRGDATAPALTLHTQVHQLSSNTLSLQSLDATSHIVWQPNGDLTITLQIKQLKTLKQHIASLVLTSKGSLNQQQWALHIDSPQQHARIEAAGHLNPTQYTWKGDIHTLKLLAPQNLSWQLKHPTTLAFGENHLQIAPFCLVGQPTGTLCGELNWTRNQALSLLLKPAQFNLALFNPFLPSQVHLNGLLTGQLKATQASRNAYTEGTFQFTLPKIAFYPESLNPASALTFNTLTLNGNLNQHGVTIQLMTEAPNKIHANLTLTHYHPRIRLLKNAPLKTCQPLQGSLSTQLTDLTPLAHFIPRIENSRGQVEGTLKIAGSLCQPQLLGNLQLSHGSVHLPDLNLTLHNATLISHFEPNYRLTFRGSAQADQGSLAINGHSQWGFPFISEVNLVAKNLKVLNSEAYKVIADGPLTIRYAPRSLPLASNSSDQPPNLAHDLQPTVSIHGHITIPQAIITPKTFSGVTTLPENIIYVDEENTTAQFNLDLTIDFKQIMLQYNGLRAQLNGNLVLSKTLESLLTAEGHLRTTEGSYHAYGQNLILQQGNLYFTGGPLTNPAMNIRAVRIIQDLNDFRNYNMDAPRLVGLQLLGTLRYPNLTLFAEPDNFSQSDILAYLLLGKSISQASNSQGEALLVAASSLGLAQSGLEQSLKKTFGLSELGFESGQVYDPTSEDLKDNTSLVLGKQITPKLTVKYSVGLLLPINIFEVIYQISDHFHIQTDSSAVDNGADVVYTINRD